ncbi:putative phage major capsid protein [Paenibacillus sp. 598K]|uniref:phage major capsid protein n=1 Tax=Paenibacillus sp. 598K TaxID=1117987 RepID=UPI000FF924B9|nr:phage major capsid protein [Paenibacillus sp. 598K]GBF73217.1 putative phage major capsid protein [Paenibacillus sp. 598K]
MNRQQYVEARKALVAEAEGYANEGSLDKFEQKSQEIEALDNKYDQAVKDRANKTAMNDRLKDLRSGMLTGDDAPLEQAPGAGIPDFWDRPSAERGALLRANNAVKLTSTGILVPTRYSDSLSPTFNEVSSLLDLVQVTPRIGGESYEKSYVVGYGEAGEVADDADYDEDDAQFGKAAIIKSKITSYSEVDQGVLELPDVDYDSEVMRGIRIAIRKRISRQILIGTGATNRLMGIFASPVAIDANKDLEITAIDDNLLDEIVYSYGGDEDVEGGATLILNKLDLKAFAQLRDGNGNKIHTIRSNGNTGTIDGIRFIINSACKRLSAAGTAGDFGMAYGNLQNYLLTIFSDIDVRRSEDYKFKSGQVAHRGSVYAGGNVIAHNGFIRVKRDA